MKTDMVDEDSKIDIKQEPVRQPAEYNCMTCHVTFDDLDEVEKHLHQEFCKYFCNRCCRQFDTKFEIVNHMFDHSMGIELPIKCEDVNDLQTESENGRSSYVDQHLDSISVDYLKTINFSSLTLEEKIKIKSIGRPKPDLSITSVTKSKSRDYKRTFKIETYEKTDWLCGCDLTHRLYCFPCLLFGNEEASEWTTSGVKDLVHLSEKIRKHQHSKSHLTAKLEFNLLGKQHIRKQLNSTYRLSIAKHNEQVKNNRYVLSKMINCIKFCGAFELREHDEEADPSNPGIFKGLLNFSAQLDLALGDNLQQAAVFKNLSKDIQNDLLECMLSVCQAHIKKEIADSTFVSIICDETTDISNIFQMVVVYRYILANGTPVERFWSFIKPNEHDALAIASSIEGVLNSALKSPDQLISQSYDGASVMSGSQGGVHLIKDKFKYSQYIHCYAHELNLIMSQTTRSNTNARIFFAELSEITSFFSKSPQRIALLNEIVGNEVFVESATEWKFSTVNTVYENTEALEACMEKIQSTSRHSDSITKAGALLRLLNDPKFVFWLTVFHRIMPHVEHLYTQLQQSTIDSVRIKRCITEFEINIFKEKNHIVTITESEFSGINESQVRKRLKTNEGTSFVSITRQAEEICDDIIAEIKRRFLFTGHLEVAHLLSVQNFKTYSTIFPTGRLEAALMNFPVLNRSKLKTELEIIYQRPDFREVSGAVHLLKFIIENNLQEDFSETLLLLQAIVTMPMTTTEPDRCFSTLTRIKTFLKSTIGETQLTAPLNALAMLSIEKHMIREIVNFNDLVIEEFISKKNGRIDFQYKTCL